MNAIEKAREIFRKLEENSFGHAVEIAKRNFHIQDKISNQ